jgi:hypothetical protein
MKSKAALGSRRQELGNTKAPRFDRELLAWRSPYLRTEKLRFALPPVAVAQKPTQRGTRRPERVRSM